MNQRKKQRGGICSGASTATSISDPTCLPNPDLGMYVHPCKNLTENQFGMPGMPGLSLRGGRKNRRRVSNRRSAGRSRQISKRRGQRGGNYFFNLNQRIGGLAQVDNTFDPYPPSLSNLKINSSVAGDVSVRNAVPYPNNTNNAVVPLVETSSLTRNSLALSGGSKKKSFLTRRSRNHLFGGSVAAFPSAFNGVPSEFSPNMETRQFNCNQPVWCPKCT
jgi:hypothetical protein